MPQGPSLSPAMAEHRRLVVWWLTGAGTLLVILLAFGGYFAVSTFGSIVHPALGCLPASFPSYPHAAVVEVDVLYGTPSVHDTKECRMRLSSKDSFENVSNFFLQGLNTGDWRQTSYVVGSTVANLEFERRSRYLTHGQVGMTRQPVGTAFAITLDS